MKRNQSKRFSSKVERGLAARRLREYSQQLAVGVVEQMIDADEAQQRHWIDSDIVKESETPPSTTWRKIAVEGDERGTYQLDSKFRTFCRSVNGDTFARGGVVRCDPEDLAAIDKLLKSTKPQHRDLLQRKLASSKHHFGDLLNPATRRYAANKAEDCAAHFRGVMSGEYPSKFESLRLPAYDQNPDAAQHFVMPPRSLMTAADKKRGGMCGHQTLDGTACSKPVSAGQAACHLHA